MIIMPQYYLSVRIDVLDTVYRPCLERRLIYNWIVICFQHIKTVSWPWIKLWTIESLLNKGGWTVRLRSCSCCSSESSSLTDTKSVVRVVLSMYIISFLVLCYISVVLPDSCEKDPLTTLRRGAGPGLWNKVLMTLVWNTKVLTV